MARKKKPLPLLEKILITDVAAEGKALAKVDGLAVFVPYVVPGDVVDLQIRRKPCTFTNMLRSVPNLSAHTTACAADASGKSCPTRHSCATNRSR